MPLVIYNLRYAAADSDNIAWLKTIFDWLQSWIVKQVMIPNFIADKLFP